MKFLLVSIMIAILFLGCKTYKTLPKNNNVLLTDEHRFVKYDSALSCFNRSGGDPSALLSRILVSSYCYRANTLHIKAYLGFQQFGAKMENGSPVSIITELHNTDDYTIYHCVEKNGKLFIIEQLLCNKEKFKLQFENNSDFFTVLYFHSKSPYDGNDIGLVYKDAAIFDDYRKPKLSITEELKQQ